jgi:hypothetical protein
MIARMRMELLGLTARKQAPVGHNGGLPVREGAAYQSIWSRVASAWPLVLLPIGSSGVLVPAKRM